MPDDVAGTTPTLYLHIPGTSENYGAATQLADATYSGHDKPHKPAYESEQVLARPQAATTHRKTAVPGGAVSQKASLRQPSRDKQEKNKPGDSPPRQAQAAPQTSTSTAANTAISNSVKKQISARFNYPLLARKRGWEGDVVLELRLEADGRMSNVRIAESSGYTLLDRAALKSARAVGATPGITQWLAGRHMDILIPVYYRLVDS
ncbi:MAG: TonB family protein [Gammaproteobacteria bacterium]|nr:TonB family protein [Gammaproteobacteria bacterium]